jgi:hypothetical protein
MVCIQGAILKGCLYFLKENPGVLRVYLGFCGHGAPYGACSWPHLLSGLTEHAGYPLFTRLNMSTVCAADRIYWALGGELRAEREHCHAELLEAAAEEGLQQAEAFEWLGHWYREVAGDELHARKCYQRALALNPTLVCEGSCMPNICLLARQHMAQGSSKAFMTNANVLLLQPRQEEGWGGVHDWRRHSLVLPWTCRLVPATPSVTFCRPAQLQPQQPPLSLTPAAVPPLLPPLLPRTSWPWRVSCWRSCLCAPLTHTGLGPGWLGCSCSSGSTSQLSAATRRL